MLCSQDLAANLQDLAQVLLGAFETAGGAMIRSMAIPLRVGAAPAGPAVNRAMAEGPDGEAVITMPAKEREN